MGNLLRFDLSNLTEVVLLEVRTLLGRGIIVLSHIPSRLAPVLAVVDHLHWNEAKLLALRSNHLREALGLAGRADIHSLSFACSGLGVFRAAIVKRDLGQAARALEDLAVDRVARHGLAAAAIATSTVEPLDLLLDRLPHPLKRRTKFVRVDGRAMVLGDECSGRTAIDGDGLPPVQQGRHGRSARATEWVEHEVTRLRVVADILPDGLVRLL